MNIEDQLKIARNVFIDLPNQFDLVKKEFYKTNEETQDLLHAFELGNLNAVEMSKIARDLRKTRRRRRELKDELEVLHEVCLLSKNKINEHTINTTIGNVRTVYERHKKRSYTMRIRKDLQNIVD